jgi:putative ABC transport system ATP-binding protein/lipoprotein-releasing system ATP-binding protein
VIVLKEVKKTYLPRKGQPVEAVRGVSLHIERGEFLVLTGRSGSGKTTLLNLIAGLTPPTSGQVFLEAVDLWSLSDHEQSALRNQKIGFIFQFPSLMPALTAHENVCLPMIFNQNHASGDATQRAATLLEMVGLAEKLKSYPSQLSAGQQQRVVIARALFNQPQLLLADEPTSDLDEQTELEIMELFKEIHRSTAVTIVLVTHTSQLVPYGTRAIHMTGGLIQAQ